ncbi:MAG: hypothetical protein WBG89_07625, partial [Ornithinimicrobium sp.]
VPPEPRFWELTGIDAAAAKVRAPAPVARSTVGISFFMVSSKGFTTPEGGAAERFDDTVSVCLALPDICDLDHRRKDLLGDAPETARGELKGCEPRA